MRLLQTDECFLQQAIELAAEAAAFASPNPTVGCVLVKDGSIIGTGAHHYDARHHAEIVALEAARTNGRSPEGATAYVSLEPCAHHGRTGPCAVALVAAGIRRCVVATLDPNPQVSGRGLSTLRDGGITVEVADQTSDDAERARRLNDAFAFSVQNGRPFITLKAAVSIDGYLAPPPTTRTGRQPHWLTGETARADVHLLRHKCDALLTGVGTVLNDNPSLTDRTGLPRRRPLLRVVLDSWLRTPIESALVQNADRDLLLVATRSAPVAAAQKLEANGVEILRVAEAQGGVDLAATLQVLQERNIRSILLEAGSSINAAFLDQNFVDEVVLYYSDVELGHGSVPFAAYTTTPNALQQRLSNTSQKHFSHDGTSGREDVRVSGYLHDPWVGISEAGA